MESIQFFSSIFLVFFFFALYCDGSNDGLYPNLNQVQTDCELEALSIGTRLADRYNSFDEQTEWDTRLHHDYLVKHLGFSSWIQAGLWKNTHLTALKRDSRTLQKDGGWTGLSDISKSPFWPLENKWLYMMGDSTQRQIWATFLSPFTSNDFERNSKEWTRENCARQFPKRKEHPSDHFFPEEGWGGRCGNNELTCHLSGFGKTGKITFDWKHFPYEDYDEWLFGETGLWQSNATLQGYPDILVVHVGLHTCVHAISTHAVNTSMISKHTADLLPMFQAISRAMDRIPSHLPRTQVIIQLPGRSGGNFDARRDGCSRSFNRVLARLAHEHHFVVFEREEIERRLLFKSEYFADTRSMKALLHLEQPAPGIVTTALLGLIGCLARNTSSSSTEQVDFRPKDL